MGSAPYVPKLSILLRGISWDSCLEGTRLTNVPGQGKALVVLVGVGSCVSEGVSHVTTQWSLDKGPGQPSWGCNLRQVPCQPNTVGKLSPSTERRSEQKGLDSVVEHVTGRGSNMACVPGEMEGSDMKGNRMREPNRVFSS
jgi:hypothetical protein